MGESRAFVEGFLLPFLFFGNYFSIMMRAGGLFRQVARPVWQQGFMASRAYAVPREDATSRVITVVKAFDKVNPEADVPTAHFSKDLGLDSLDIVELGLALEEEFAIEIPDADAEGLLSVPDAVEYLSAHPQSR